MTAVIFKYILFDLIGTTVQDRQGSGSLIIESFKKAFSLHGIDVSYPEVNQQRGKSKKDAVNCILDQKNQSVELAGTIYSDFINLLNDSLPSLSEFDGVSRIFSYLKEKNIKIGLGSGLPMDLVIKIIKTTGWDPDTFDYIGSSELLGKGRPDPVMINDFIYKLDISDRSGVLKVGDTIADIREGKNAGVKTAVVLSGTQNREELEKHQPDYILYDIREIITII